MVIDRLAELGRPECEYRTRSVPYLAANVPRPHLDNGLVRYTQVPRLLVKSRYHPGRKTHIDALRFLSRGGGPEQHQAR
jgi:hypothetical protein